MAYSTRCYYNSGLTILILFNITEVYALSRNHGCIIWSCVSIFKTNNFIHYAKTNTAVVNRH